MFPPKKDPMVTSAMRLLAWLAPNGQIRFAHLFMGYGWARNGLRMGYQAKRPLKVGVFSS